MGNSFGESVTWSKAEVTELVVELGNNVARKNLCHF